MAIPDFIRAQERMLGRFGIEARSRFLDVSAVGGRAHVLAWGAGPPVMMLSGLGTPAAMWAPLMARLPGCSLLAVDLPGFGLTDTAARVAAEPRAFATDFLEQVLDQLGLRRPAFVANSLGALWATWLALDRPDRVAAMVHVGCPALLPGSSAPLPMRLLAVRPLGRVLMRLQPPSPRQVEQLVAMVKEDLSDLPELRELLLECERLPGYQATFLPLLQALLSFRGPRPATRLTEEQLARVASPVQLIWGADDPFGPVAAAERAAQTMPRAELHVVPGGHAPWLSHAEEVARVATPFLARHAAPPAS
jgi:2-hydroxy-6-oxonona-2,4-dienedioate hydrolase